MFATTLHRQENPDRKVSTEREHAEWTAKFLAMIDQAAGHTSVINDLARLDTLSLPDLLRQSPSVGSETIGAGLF